MDPIARQALSILEICHFYGPFIWGKYQDPIRPSIFDCPFRRSIFGQSIFGRLILNGRFWAFDFGRSISEGQFLGGRFLDGRFLDGRFWTVVFGRSILGRTRKTLPWLLVYSSAVHLVPNVISQFTNESLLAE